MRTKILLSVAIICIGCRNNAENGNTKPGITPSGANQEQNTSVHATASNANSSIAGMYIQSFSGPDSRGYEFKFENGKYTGRYQESYKGKRSEVLIEYIKVNEADTTVSFYQGTDYVVAKLVPEGLKIGADIFEKR